MRSEKIKPVASETMAPIAQLREMGVTVDYRPEGWRFEITGLHINQAARFAAFVLDSLKPREREDPA